MQFQHHIHAWSIYQHFTTRRDRFLYPIPRKWQPSKNTKFCLRGFLLDLAVGDIVQGAPRKENLLSTSSQLIFGHFYRFTTADFRHMTFQKQNVNDIIYTFPILQESFSCWPKRWWKLCRIRRTSSGLAEDITGRYPGHIFSKNSVCLMNMR